MSFIEKFSAQVRDAHVNQDTTLYSQLISLSLNNPTVNRLIQELNHTNENQATQIVQAVLEDTSYSLSECIVNYLQVLRCLCDENIDFVFETFATFYSSCIPVFNGSDTFYQVPVIKDLSTHLVSLALRVDKTGLKGKARKANTAARLLSRMFNTMLADRSPIDTSKRQGIFHVTNLAFKVYFKLNSMRMCQTFISNIEKGGLELHMFPISQQVTYKYYLGRYSLYHGKLKQAQNCLLYAFEKCHASQWHNKRTILHYLIPTRIILGYFPSVQLLEKYQLSAPFLNMMRLIRAGDIHGYYEHIETHFNYFYGKMTYLLLKERGVVLVWRCLIKNVYNIKQHATPAPPTSSVLDFHDCLTALKLASRNPNYTIEDMECMLVSLVSQNYIRGYLQHTKQILVLSKVNAFPPISNVRLITEVYNESLMEDHMNNAQPPLPQEILQYMENE